jgi:hypothetical protein
MDSPNPGLDFERPIYELDSRLKSLERSGSDRPETQDEIRRLRRELVDVTKRVFSQLTPWQVVQLARHPSRPHTIDYISLLFEEFIELHGDRRFGDDRAILTGFAKLDEFKVMLVGHEKGKNFKERSACYFGCAHPEGYRLGVEFRRPVLERSGAHDARGRSVLLRQSGQRHLRDVELEGARKSGAGSSPPPSPYSSLKPGRRSPKPCAVPSYC